MCIVEQKTYYQADGSPRLYESIRRCSNAIGPGPCSNVTHTFANIVETRPDSSSRTTSSTRVESTSKADVVVTDSRGQTRVYRDLSRRSSQRTKPSRSRREDDRTSRERRQAAPSPVYDTARPSPISRTATPNSAPPMMSSFPPSLQPESTGSGRIATDGTAIYDSPASHLPRVPVAERRPTTPTARKVSFKDTPTSPNEPDRSRHPNLSTNTAREREPSSLRPSLSSPRRASPGLSQLSSHHHARKDSARDLPSRDALRKDLNSPSNDSEYLTRQSAREESRRQTAQLRRQADLQAAEDRHLEREAAAAAAAASRLQPEPLLFPTQQRSSIDSDRSTWSRHTSPPRGAYFPSGEAEEQRQGQARRYAASTSPLAQPFTRRSRNQKTTYGVPTLHQDPIVTPGASTTRAIDPLSERGMEVVEERRRERRERDEHVRNEKAYHDRKREGQTRGRYHEQQPKREERGYEAEGFDEVVRERERRTEGYYVSEGLGVAREAVRRKKRERGEGREGREFWD